MFYKIYDLIWIFLKDYNFRQKWFKIKCLKCCMLKFWQVKNEYIPNFIFFANPNQNDQNSINCLRFGELFFHLLFNEIKNCWTTIQESNLPIFCQDKSTSSSENFPQKFNKKCMMSFFFWNGLIDIFINSSLFDILLLLNSFKNKYVRDSFEDLVNIGSSLAQAKSQPLNSQKISIDLWQFRQGARRVCAG